MQQEDQPPATKPAAVLKPPRPPGPPTRTTLGLAPELPGPDDQRGRASTTAIASSPSIPAKTGLAVLDEGLAILAAAAAVVAAVSVWSSLLILAL